MHIFSGAKQKDELILVFNIGSSSVSGALFYAQNSGIPKIIFSVREPIKIEIKAEIDRFLSLTVQALEIVSQEIYKAGLGAPSKIFCVLASTWYVSQTRIINLKKNTPFIFTAKLADDLIQKEIKIFEEEHREKYKNVGEQSRIIELKNIKTMLNGYETPKPLNQKGQELEMTIFISLSGEQVLRKMEDTITKYFHPDLIKFSSFTLASFAVVRDMQTEKENFLLIDIGGEITDISMVKKNVLRESITFPLGCNFLIRGVAGYLGSTLEEASSLISLFKDGHGEETFTKKIESIMEKLKTEWLKLFQESLANLSHDISIPATIYLAIDKENADFFFYTIKNEQFNQYTLTESKFEIVFLNTEILHGLAIFEESAVRESFIIIDAIYINRFLIHSIK
jgi:hypothetical protein